MTPVLSWSIYRYKTMQPHPLTHFFLRSVSPGTVRRRRSRVPSEEDDTLLDYLRSASNDNPRERRSWGGLGMCRGGVECYGWTLEG